jgi:ribonuclease D
MGILSNVPENALTLQDLYPDASVTLVHDSESLRSMSTYMDTRPTMLGLDCEWRPINCKDDHSLVSLLQLSDGRASFLVDMQTLCSQEQKLVGLTELERRLDICLAGVFSDPATTIVGFSTKGDLMRLAASYPALTSLQKYAKVIDVAVLYKPLFSKARSPSLAALVGTAFGRSLDKSQQRSSWHLRPLSEKQVLLRLV